MDKKGQGISMNVIIIAAIALLVLVVVAAIFLMNMGPFNSNVNNCEPTFGTCTDAASCTIAGVDKNCEDESSICCPKGMEKQES